MFLLLKKLPLLQLDAAGAIVSKPAAASSSVATKPLQVLPLTSERTPISPAIVGLLKKMMKIRAFPNGSVRILTLNLPT